MRPTGDQDIACFTPTMSRRSATFERIDHEKFSRVILEGLIQEAQLAVSGERMCTILVTRLED